MQNRLPVVVLISGKGSNLQALIDAEKSGLAIDVRAVISNQPAAGGLDHARNAGIETAIVDHSQFPARDNFDQALMECIEHFEPQLICLAGFMRILGSGFIRYFDGKMINIHPSLLPKYPGLDTHRRALEAGDREHGASVHFVSEAVDGGPVIAQTRLPILPEDTVESLAQRVLLQEHQLYPEAIGWIADGRLQLQGTRVLLDGVTISLL